MIPCFVSALLLFGVAFSQEPQPSADEAAPAALAATRLPVLTDRMRAQAFSEAAIRALLETALGSGVSLASLVGALDVVVEQLEAGVSVSGLAVRLPGWIGQGLRGEELAKALRGAEQGPRAPGPEGARPSPSVSAAPVSAD